MSGFDFNEGREAFIDNYIPVGAHLVQIESYRFEKDSMSGNKQFSLTFKAKDGATGFGYFTVTETVFDKIVGLSQHTGVPFTEDEQEHIVQNRQVPESWLKRLVGKFVGAVWREEEKYGEPGKMTVKFQGTAPVEKVGGKPGSSDLDNRVPVGSSSNDDDIPF